MIFLLKIHHSIINHIVSFSAPIVNTYNLTIDDGVTEGTCKSNRGSTANFVYLPTATCVNKLKRLK